jgi:hypothetical protein
MLISKFPTPIPADQPNRKTEIIECDKKVTYFQNILFHLINLVPPVRDWKYVDILQLHLFEILTFHFLNLLGNIALL